MSPPPGGSTTVSLETRNPRQAKKFHNAPHVGIHSQSSQVSEIDYTTSGIDPRPFWLGYEALMKHAFLPLEWKVIFQRNCDAASVEKWNTDILYHIIAPHNFMTWAVAAKTTVSALFGLSSMASQRAPFNKSSPTFELSLQLIYDIHLIPKWRPINYSFVCMFISPFDSFWLQNSFV